MRFREKPHDHHLRQCIADILEANENRVRIIDFGVAYDSTKGYKSKIQVIYSESSIYGTPMSMPPEVYNANILTTARVTLRRHLGHHVTHQDLNKACNFGMCRDIWSLGVLLYTMVTGIAPFYVENIKKLSEKIMFSEPDYEIPTLQHEYALKDLLKRMLY